MATDNNKLPEQTELKDLLHHYDHTYGQLSALKHIVYSSLSLLDPEPLAAVISQQITNCITDKKNAVWLKNRQEQFVQTALDGSLLPDDRRLIIGSESPGFPEGMLSGRMRVWAATSPEGPIGSGFSEPSFFPFKSGEQVTGFLVVDQVPPGDRDVFQFVAQFAAMVLNNARLYGELEKRREELEEMTGLLLIQNEQMSALHHVGIQIAIAPDPPAICKLTTDALVEELGAEKAVAFLTNGATGELYWVSKTGDLRDIDDVGPAAHRLPPVQHSLESGRIVTCNDYPTPLDLGNNRFEKWAVYPLKCKGRVIGAVVAESEDISISDQAAILINHAGIVIDTLLVLDKVSEEREKLADTLSSIGDGVLTTDLQGCITLMNRVAENLTGWHSKESKGRHLEEVFGIIDEQTRRPVRDILPAALRGDFPKGAAHPVLLVSREGIERPVVMSGTPIKDAHNRNVGTVIVFRDITDLRRLEQESLKVQKLESLGVMAGGLAHDFNNLLGVILGNINIAQLRLQPDDPAAIPLKQAEQAVYRAGDLTKKFITFSSGGEPMKSRTVIIDLLRDVAHLASSGSNVKYEVSCEDRLWPVEVDDGQMRQVFCNVLENARQAMPLGGIVQINAENCIVDDVHIEKGLQVPRGEYVRISVVDHGVGIEAEHLPKIFDPYYSTRARGTAKGMGMGLAVAHTVIRKHGGEIRADSCPGKGTSIYMYLPAAKVNGRI